MRMWPPSHLRSGRAHSICYFKPSNNMLKAMVCKYLKSPQSCKDNSYKCISNTDLEALSLYFARSLYFDRSSAKKLQEEVFFNSIYHKGYPGREWIRNLKVSDLKIYFDESGTEYADPKLPVFSKNTKGSVDEKYYSCCKQSRIYAEDQKCTCPVEAIKLYLSKIPPNVEDLFPMPKRRWNFQDRYWYAEKQVLGKNQLGTKMSTISSDAKLSTIYTNHCIRATCVTRLANKGFSISDIQAVTGHKRADSVQRYIKQIDSEKKRKLSNALSTSVSQVNDEVDAQPSEERNNDISVTNTAQSNEHLFRNCLFSNCTININ